jgi:hypothetical protein
MWRDIHTKIHEDSYRHLNNIKVWLQKFEGCNVGITDGKFANYTVKVSLGALIYMMSYKKNAFAIQI